MGKSYTPIMFFNDDIKIAAHSATFARHLARPISIGEFADGSEVRVFKCDETGEYSIRKGRLPNQVFMEGPEA